MTRSSDFKMADGCSGMLVMPVPQHAQAHMMLTPPGTCANQPTLPALLPWRCVPTSGSTRGRSMRSGLRSVLKLDVGHRAKAPNSPPIPCEQPLVCGPPTPEADALEPLAADVPAAAKLRK
mmetsp:Transcript_96099/g.311785  ORF Transcript_96099/g.311785 Transcript_96099/m.311785 type:complete len:121 (-) Transcript_96099:49-411(-)